MPLMCLIFGIAVSIDMIGGEARANVKSMRLQLIVIHVFDCREEIWSTVVGIRSWGEIIWRMCSCAKACIIRQRRGLDDAAAAPDLAAEPRALACIYASIRSSWTAFH